MVTRKIVPAQTIGASTEVKEERDFSTLQNASLHFEIANQRLLEVYNWDKICDLPSAVFTLLDRDGHRVTRLAMIGDYFKIDIPGPGNSKGDGYDWVRIEQIVSSNDVNYQQIAMQVRPCPNPFGDQDATAHFFEEKATSTFVVKRIGKTVSAEVHGRNETANTETGALINDLRNALIAWGAKFGFSFPQWKSLVIGIMKD